VFQLGQICLSAVVDTLAPDWSSRSASPYPVVITNGTHGDRAFGSLGNGPVPVMGRGEASPRLSSASGQWSPANIQGQLRYSGLDRPFQQFADLADPSARLLEASWVSSRSHRERLQPERTPQIRFHRSGNRGRRASSRLNSPLSARSTSALAYSAREPPSSAANWRRTVLPTSISCSTSGWAPGTLPGGRGLRCFRPLPEHRSCLGPDQ